jgi:anti-anti-sigma factor
MENLTVEITDYPENKHITVMIVKGFLDTLTAPLLEEKLKLALLDKKFKLIVDLSGVDYICSAGWGVFVSELKGIRNAKGDLVLAGMKPEVSQIFDLLEFKRFMKSFPDAESAAKKAFLNPPRNPRKVEKVQARHHG